MDGDERADEDASTSERPSTLPFRFDKYEAPWLSHTRRLSRAAHASSPSFRKPLISLICRVSSITFSLGVLVYMATHTWDAHGWKSVRWTTIRYVTVCIAPQSPCTAVAFLYVLEQ
ncbi:hypothetical protein BC628DRAFT_18797 [Trametes gibbosa]|nr:hypothetical protein BC628DRAFT_18797 [Trametes gibbosa]